MREKDEGKIVAKSRERKKENEEEREEEKREKMWCSTHCELGARRRKRGMGGDTPLWEYQSCELWRTGEHMHHGVKTPLCSSSSCYTGNWRSKSRHAWTCSNWQSISQETNAKFLSNTLHSWHSHLWEFTCDYGWASSWRLVLSLARDTLIFLRWLFVYLLDLVMTLCCRIFRKTDWTLTKWVLEKSNFKCELE